MTPERSIAIKQQALKAIAEKAKNKNCPGVSLVAISPHEALEYVKLSDEDITRNQPVVLLDPEAVDKKLTELDWNSYSRYDDHDDIILDGHYTLEQIKQLVAIAEGK